MPNAMTTVGQGSAAYVSVGGTAITNASTQNWRIGGKHKVPSLAVNSQIAGQSSSTQHAVRVYTDGSVAFRTTATDRVRTAAGVVSPGVDFTWALENKVGVGMTLTVNGADIGTFGTSSNFPINQLHRFSTTAASEVTTSEFFHEIAGVMQSLWNATNAPGTGPVWTSSGAITRTLTITAYTGVADSWWVFYSSMYIGEGTLTATATANVELTGSKIGLANIPAVIAAALAVDGCKIGTVQLSIPLAVGIDLSAVKVGLADMPIQANADVNLYAGNVYIGTGTFSMSADANVALIGSKVGASQVEFVAVAAAYLQGTKTGNSIAPVTVGSALTLDGYKIGHATAVVLASATITLSGGRVATESSPVTVVFMRTSSKWSYNVKTSSRTIHNVKTTSRYQYHIKTFSGGDHA